MPEATAATTGLSARPADEAMTIGLADKVMPSEEVLPAALADAAEWARKATLGIAAAKRALAAGRGIPLEEGLDVEKEAFAESFVSDDAVEGVTAFVEKRSAEFKGG